MRRAVIVVAWLLLSPAAMPLSAQEETRGSVTFTDLPDDQLRPVAQTGPASQAPAATAPAATAAEVGPVEPLPWQTTWGLVGLRGIYAGPKIATNGELYHPNFSLDWDFNFWIWRSQRLYIFADMRLWGETGEDGVTNGRDGFLGTSKREFDLSGGAAWNYAGPWELRAFGYTQNNLNRGTNLLTPFGFNDGFGLENRFYLSPEYAKLGQNGFDVARATFLSIGYYPSKSMVGNDGQQFEPGLQLRAYLIYDLWDWPCYLFGDLTYISEKSFQPRLLLFDVGVALRPFHSHQQWEFRIGAESTADLKIHDDLTLWYVSLRFIY